MSILKFDGKAPAIVLDVLLTNKGIKKMVKMVLDTGSSYVLISWEVAEALDLKPAFSEKRTDIITASGTERAPLVAVDAITVVDKTQEHVDVLVHDLPAQSYVHGLLGLSFLRNFNIQINFKEGMLEII